MPSVSIVKVITFFASDISEFRKAKRGWSWFSLKVPRSEVSLHEVFTALTASTKPEILPDVLVKAAIRGL